MILNLSDFKAHLHVVGIFLNSLNRAGSDFLTVEEANGLWVSSITTTIMANLETKLPFPIQSKQGL